MGGFLYVLIEILWRGHTHWTMGVVGGVAFVIVGLINEILSWKIPLYLQGLIGSLIITSIEFISGCILNLWLKMNIWDYSSVCPNIMGQVCLQYSILWFVLSILCIVTDDYIRYWFFNEEKPRYRFI